MDIKARNSHKVSKIVSYNSGIMGFVTKKSFQKRAACFTLLFMLFQVFSPVGTLVTKNGVHADTPNPPAEVDITVGANLGGSSNPAAGSVTASGTGQLQTGSSSVFAFDYGSTATLTAHANTGYSFASWSGSCTGTTNPVDMVLDTTHFNTFSSTDSSQNGLTCTANFTQTPTTYTITFNSNGGSSVAAVSGVTSGAKVSAPTNPTKSGYTFDYWYFQNQLGGTTQWDFTSDTVTADTTLYAHWTAVATTYSVTFNSNGGSSVATTTGVHSGATITAPTPPTKTDYTFSGWYKESGLTNIWDFTSDTVTADTTLYAKWVATLGATFDITSGTASVTKSGATINFGSTLPSNTGSGFNLTVTPATTSDNAAPTGKDLVETYTITPSTTLTGTYTAEITLTYPDGTEHQDGDTVQYWNGSAWATTGITVTGNTASTITFTTTHFTEFAILTESTGGAADTADKTSDALPDAGASVMNIFVNMLLAIIAMSLLVLATRKTKLSFILS